MKKKFALSLLVFIFLIVVVMAGSSKRAPDHPYYSSDLPYPLVIAHQGGDGLWPGDTLYAFEQAATLGVDVLEMDLHITKDGVLVINHDETVDRTTDGNGEIEEMTLAELKALDDGYDWSHDGGQTFPYRGMGITIPALDEILQAFPEFHMTIEIKKTAGSMAMIFCETIRSYGMQDKILVASFYDERMAEFRRVCPEVATASARQETTVFVLLSKAFLSRTFSPSFYSLQVPEESSGISVMTAQFVHAAHERNLRVEPWTIDDPEQMKQYIEWGVDSIITDRPDLMLQVLGR